MKLDILNKHGLAVRELDVAPGLPKRLCGSNVLSLYGGKNDCALACFHSVAYHKNIDIFCKCQFVFPVTLLFSVAHNFIGFNDI